MMTTMRPCLPILASALLVLSSCAGSYNYELPTVPRYAGTPPVAPDPEPAIRVVTFNVAFAGEVEKAIDLLDGHPELRDADLVFPQ